MSLRKLVVALAATGCLVLLGGCTGTKSGPISQKDFAKQFRSHQGVSSKWADCMATQLFDNKDHSLRLTTAERKAFNATNPKASLSKSIAPKAEKAGEACKAKGLTP